MSSDLIDGNKILNKQEAQRLWKKLEMKYGVEIQDLNARSERDMAIFGSIQPETEAQRNILIKKIESENVRVVVKPLSKDDNATSEKDPSPAPNE